jgi:hypothetical protein
MEPLPPSLAFFLLLFPGGVNRQQQAVIDYLVEKTASARRLRGDLSLPRPRPPACCCVITNSRPTGSLRTVT